MRGVYVIGFDVHSQTTDIAVLTPGGRLRCRDRQATRIPALREVIRSVPHPRHLVIEEGPLSDWLMRNLETQVDKLTACDPRRNHLIAKDSDKDDAIDAEKLAQLYQGGYVRSVHHPATFERAVFKETVGLYHDRVRNRVRQANRIISQFRRHGLVIHETHFTKPEGRPTLLDRLPSNGTVRANLATLWLGYDAAVQQQLAVRQRVIRLAKREPDLKRFCALPGVKWIRASTFFAYVDTPWRFKSKSALWKYLGIGLQRRQSGQGHVQLKVPFAVNKTLKNVILGAAKSAVASGSNPFADQYNRWLHAGSTPRIARRNVARSLSAVMWGMWKSGSDYRPQWVGGAVSATAAP